MIANASAEHCLSFINSQLQARTQAGGVREEKCPPGGDHFPAGRVRGGGRRRKLAALSAATFIRGACPWTVFDRNLMDKVLEDHNLPTRLAKFLPEDRVSQMEDILADVFDVHPPSQTVIDQTTETILKLAGLGNVILIGRGSNVITARLPHVLHVRLVAPLEKRIEHARQFYHLTGTEAHKFCLSQDRARERYLKKYFNADINDPLLYHLIINTGLVSYDDAAKLIGDAVLNLNQG